LASVAGLVAKLCFHKVIAVRGHDARLNSEFARIDVELRLGIRRQGQGDAGRVGGILSFTPVPSGMEK